MEERRRILKMLEEGKINTGQAEELLYSIEKKVEDTKVVKAVSGKKLRIKVESEEGENVNVCIPLSLAKIATHFIPKEKHKSLESSGVDIEAIIQHIDELGDIEEDIVNVESDGEKVRIYIE
ncbi:hypothetical protein LR066_01600 [candidate division WOR-3 bacterium]|nr:hypothetical protein [candidate division WOR-3 bacterium]